MLRIGRKTVWEAVKARQTAIRQSWEDKGGDKGGQTDGSETLEGRQTGGQLGSNGTQTDSREAVLGRMDRQVWDSEGQTDSSWTAGGRRQDSREETGD